MAPGFLGKIRKSPPAGSASGTDDKSRRRHSDKKTADASTTVIQVPSVTTGDMFGSDEVARAANQHEQSMSMRYTVKYYHVAMIWAALMAAPIIMEGYETALVPNFFSYEAFKKRFGRQAPGQTEYTIPTAWQSGITVAAAGGQLIGLWLAPRVVNRMGYRICSAAGFVCAGLCLMVGFWSMGTGNPLAVFLAGEFLLGIPWGLFQGITLPYVSDITPLQLRAPATTMINVFWLVGQLVSASVLRGTREIKNEEWSIKAPMLVQYGWLLPLLFVAFMAPESPLYLTRNDQDEQAKKVLRRLNRDPLFDADGALSVMRAVNAHEKEQSEQMGLLGCFKGINLRRTEIAVMVYVTQQWVGTPLMFYSVKLLQKGGLSEEHALCVTTGMYALCILSTLSSMLVMRRVGRRTLWLGGLLFEITCLATIGSLSFFCKDGPKAISWIIAAFLILFAVVYNFTIGPVCYTIVAETPATRTKAATNSIARGTYIVLAIANLFLVPNLLENKPVGWGLGARAALVWAGTAAVCLAWAWFRLPEMKDRTPAEIDLLFENKIAARHWRKAVVWRDYELT